MPSLTARFRDEAMPALAGAWRWWTAELASLLPAGTSRLFPAEARADIRPSRTGVDIVRSAKGQAERLAESIPLRDFDAANWAELNGLIAGHRTRLILSPPLCHLVTLRLPRSARPYLRTAIPLQLADHAPLPIDQLIWRTVDTRLIGETLVVRVAMAKRDTLDAIEDGFLEQDMSCPPILAELPDGKLVTLRSGRAVQSGLERPWRWACLIAALTPFLLLLLLHLLVLVTRHRVEETEMLARPKLQAERSLRQRAEVARGLNRTLAIPSATSLLEDLADRLPPGVHALDVTVGEGGAVHFTLAAPDEAPVKAALDGDPRFADLRQLDVSKAPDRSTTLRYEARLR